MLGRISIYCRVSVQVLVRGARTTLVSGLDLHRESGVSFVLFERREWNGGNDDPAVSFRGKHFTEIDNGAC